MELDVILSCFADYCVNVLGWRGAVRDLSKYSVVCRDDGLYQVFFKPRDLGFLGFTSNRSRKFSLIFDIRSDTDVRVFFDFVYDGKFILWNHFDSDYGCGFHFRFDGVHWRIVGN